MNDLNNDINMSNDNNVNNNTDDTIEKIAVNLINIHEYNDENKDINNNSSSNSNHNNDKSSISLEKTDLIANYLLSPNKVLAAFIKAIITLTLPLEMKIIKMG